MTDGLTVAFCIGLPFLHAVIALLLPGMYPRSIPFGVRIPQTRITDPALKAAKALYHQRIVWALVMVIAANVMLSFVLGEVAILAAGTLASLIIVWPHIVAHSYIESAKRRGDWYYGVETRISASIKGDPSTARVKVIPTWHWYIAAFVFPLIGAWRSWQIYPEIPDPMPVHWDAAGNPDSFSPKSLPEFLLQTVGITAGIIIFVMLVNLFVQKVGTNTHQMDLGRAGGLTTQQELQRYFVVQQSAMDALGWFTFWLVGAIQMLMLRSVDPNVSSSGWDLGVFLFITLILTIALVAWPFWQGKQFDKRAGIGPEGTEVPDDTEHWAGGLFYINGQDPAVFVPKRSGGGLTLNLGSPWGLVIAIGLLIVPLAVVATQLM